MGELSARVSRERRACLRAQEELEALQAELASQVPVPFFLPVLASGPSRVPAPTAPQQRPNSAPVRLRLRTCAQTVRFARESLVALGARPRGLSGPQLSHLYNGDPHPALPGSTGVCESPG